MLFSREIVAIQCGCSFIIIMRITLVDSCKMHACALYRTGENNITLSLPQPLYPITVLDPFYIHSIQRASNVFHGSV